MPLSSNLTCVATPLRAAPRLPSAPSGPGLGRPVVHSRWGQGLHPQPAHPVPRIPSRTLPSRTAPAAPPPHSLSPAPAPSLPFPSSFPNPPDLISQRGKCLLCAHSHGLLPGQLGRTGGGTLVPQAPVQGRGQRPGYSRKCSGATRKPHWLPFRAGHLPTL